VPEGFTGKVKIDATQNLGPFELQPGNETWVEIN
jgi:hypothetical protein